MRRHRDVLVYQTSATNLVRDITGYGLTCELTPPTDGFAFVPFPRFANLLEKGAGNPAPCVSAWSLVDRLDL